MANFAAAGFGRASDGPYCCGRSRRNPFRLSLTLGKHEADAGLAGLFGYAVISALTGEIGGKSTLRRRGPGIGVAIRIHVFLETSSQGWPSPDRHDWEYARTQISHQKGMKHVRYCSFRLGSPEPALIAVNRPAARHHPKRPRHGQRRQLGP